VPEADAVEQCVPRVVRSAAWMVRPNQGYWSSCEVRTTRGTRANTLTLQPHPLSLAVQGFFLKPSPRSRSLWCAVWV